MSSGLGAESSNIRIIQMNVTLRRLLVGTMAFPLIDIRRYCMCKFEVSTS